MISLVYEDCAWLAKLASLARTMVGLLSSVDCTCLDHSRSSLHSQGSKLTSTCFTYVVWLALLGYTAIGSFAAELTSLVLTGFGQFRK